MTLPWHSFVPYHVALDIAQHPNTNPVDRQQRLNCVALFADVSGFTAISEALGKTGKAGTEELTTLLNSYFTPMIDLIHTYGGIIGKFGGDAMTILFPYTTRTRQTTVRRSIQCALEMQANMDRYAALSTSAGIFSLTMKAGLAMGSVLCTTVGDPTTRLEFIIAGEVLDLCADAEHHATKGEVVIHNGLLIYAGAFELVEERQGFSCIDRLKRRPKPVPLPSLGDFSEQALNWLTTYLHPIIAERIQAGQTGFIDEHRKVTILFIRFSGFDYDHDPGVASKLQHYLNAVIRIVQRYGGYLNKVDMGDKGSKAIVLFGTPLAHENDEERALRCALELKALPDSPAHIGVNTGYVYCGQVGSPTRREYTAMGDAVNLAARLMQAAKPNQILVSDSTHQAAGDSFTWRELEPIQVKGKSEPIKIYEAEAITQTQPRLLEQNYTLPMIGRTAELSLAQNKIEQARQGRGQILGLTGEAGLGKSRLAAEIIKLARASGLTGFGGAAQSYGRTASYLVWRDLWRSFFALDPAWSEAEQIDHLENQLTRLDPQLSQRLPLLRPVLNLPIPENSLTEPLDAQARADLLKSLLLRCLQLQAQLTPLLLVLEDAHWLDPLSRELLTFLGRNIGEIPVMILVVYRPGDNRLHPLGGLQRLRFVEECQLTTFSTAETEQLIQLKLGQLFDLHGTVPDLLMKQIMDKAQGNPFYIEELVNLLHDQGLDPEKLATLRQLDLPDSLHRLIISRIDYLTENEKTILKVASVIGRLFKANWLWGSYPPVGPPQTVADHLDNLLRHDLTRLENPEPELEYLFKHITTQEVAYESLAFATRERLHEAVGQFIEQTHADHLDQYIDVLAYHFGRSQNRPKQRFYFRRAGDVAKAAYANEAAIENYQKLLPLLPEAEQSEVMRLIGEVWHLTGDWSEADHIYRQALTIAEKYADKRSEAYCRAAIGRLLSNTKSYQEATIWLEAARNIFEQLDDQSGLNDLLGYLSFVYLEQGDYRRALNFAEQQHNLATSMQDQIGISTADENKGLVYWARGDYTQAINHLQQAITIGQAANFKSGVIIACNDIAGVYWETGDFAQSFIYLHQALTTAREIGDLHSLGMTIGNAGEIHRLRGDYEQALKNYGQAIYIAIELGDWASVPHVASNIATVFMAQNRFAEAHKLFGRVVVLRRPLNNPYFLCEDLHRFATLQDQQMNFVEAQSLNQEALAIATAVENREIQFPASILDIRLRATLGQIKPAAARDEFEALFATWLEDDHQAAIHYELWRLDQTREAARIAAANLYKSLYQRSPKAEYRQRYQTLTNETLPPPPPSPALPEVISARTIDLDSLLTTVETLTSE